MGQVNIHAAEYPILKVFSSDFFFSIPQYQRPYAWTTEQAEELLDDLLTFIEGEESIENLPPYFLGSIVLKKEDGPNAEVIDGQQRLTTLTILLSVLRTLVPVKYARAITPYLYQEADLMAGTPNRYRVRLRDRDEEFFQKYLQDEDGIDQLETINMSQLSDSQKNLRGNAELFLHRLQDITEQQRVFLAQAIVNRCFLVVVSTPTLDSAYRIFSVMNDRGLNLSHVDILKAQVIGAIPEQERTRYTKKWEDIEVDLGRDAFQSLFAHIRMIYRKAKPRDTVLEEFRQYVWPTHNASDAMKAQALIDDVLVPCAWAFSTIKDADYVSTRLAEKLNILFKWLNQIDNSDWIPSAILYLSKNEHQPELLVHFFADLERLAAGLMLLRVNVNKRIERYSRLLSAIEKQDNLYVLNSPLQLTIEEQRDIVNALDGHLYGWGYCKYVLLRLDEALGDGTASYKHPIISIEHVLPQHPALNSTWIGLFPDREKREEYVHRLGNLVLLSRKKNGAAQNYDFKKKVDIYFKNGGSSSFRLTSQVIGESRWTPAVIERRQRELLDKLKGVWRLN